MKKDDREIMLGHLGALGVCRELAGLVVERFDLLGDGEVLVGDGPVGDAGVDQRHGQRLVSDMRVIASG